MMLAANIFRGVPWPLPDGAVSVSGEETSSMC